MPFEVVTIGSCTLYRADAYELLATLPPGALCTDPPYGMRWNMNQHRFTRGRSPQSRGKRRPYDAPVRGDDTDVDMRFVQAYDEAIVWGYNHLAQTLGPGGVLVWIKKHDTAFGAFLSDAELAWMKGKRGVYCRRDTSWKGALKTRVHPAQKPVGILAWCLTFLKASVVIDPFMGVGTTGLACMQHGKTFVGIEIERRYFDLACQRITDVYVQGGLLAASTTAVRKMRTFTRYPG